MGKRTTFVLGAGASVDYGMISQRDLPSKLFSECHRPNAKKVLHELGIDQVTLNDFIESMNNCRVSYDEWLDTNDRYRELGKILISLILLNCEAGIPARRNDSWYGSLYDHHFHKRQLSKFAEACKNIRFITFNYDRTLEYFMHMVLSNQFRDQQDLVNEQLKKLEVIHIHGKFADLPHESVDNIPYGAVFKNINESDPKKFNVSDTANYVRKASKKIDFMFGETDLNRIQRIHEMINESDNIMFMGFGYDPANLKKLGIFDDIFTNKIVKGTIKGLSQREISNVLEQMSGIVSKENLMDINCYEFINLIQEDIN